MKLLTKLFLVLLLLGLWNQNTSACQCTTTKPSIDNVHQMNEYNFIAHVKIIDSKIAKNRTGDDYRNTGELTFEIIELFKGKKLKTIFEDSKNTSCDIGVLKGEEWILFGKLINGETFITPCDRNKRYKKKDGLRDWKSEKGLTELRQLKSVFNRNIAKFETGKRQEYYNNGQIEIEESYVNGRLKGERKIWHPNGKLLCKQFYVNDTLDKKSEWFYESGQIYDEELYQKGKLTNVSRQYYDSALVHKQVLIKGYYKTEDTLKYINNRIQVKSEKVFDSYGRAILYRSYTHLGRISNEIFVEPDREFRTTINYHDNGMVSVIYHSLSGVSFGRSQSYDKDGLPLKGWNYDEKGRRILDK